MEKTLVKYGTCEACGRTHRQLRSRKLKNDTDSPLIWACRDDLVHCYRLAQAKRERLRRHLIKQGQAS